MEPHFAGSYRATIKKWKTSGVDNTFLSAEETVSVIADDIVKACLKAEEYIGCLCTNSDWKTGEVVGIFLEKQVFVGTKEIIPQTGILSEGFKGYPCCHE